MDENQFAAGLIEMNMAFNFQESMEKALKYCEKNSKSIKEAFNNSFKELLKTGILLQEQGKIGDIAFLTISLLRTFIMEKDYRLRLDLYDKSYFLGKVECARYLDLEFILKYIDEDIDAFVKGFAEYGVRYKKYEIEELKKSYINVYMDVIHKFITENIKNVLELNEYDLLNKSPDIKIVFGEYLDETVVIYDGQQENEKR